MLARDEDAAEIAARRGRLRGARARRRPAAAPGADPLAEADRPARRRRGVRPGARPPLRRAGAGDRRLRLRGRYRGAAQSHRRPRVRPPRGLRAGQPRGEGADRGQESLARQEHVHLAHLRAQGRRHHDARGPARQDDGLRGSQLVVRLHLSDGPADPAGPREEPRSQDLLPRGHVRGCARRGEARAAQRPRGRDRLVRHGARAVPDRPRRAREDRVRRGDGADPRGGYRRARRAGARRRREGARGAAADAWPRLRVAAQAHVRHRRLRAGRGPRLRSRARGRRAARRPTTLNAVVSAPSTMIEVAGLRVVLPPDVVAVDGVDLVIRPGEFVVILGRSGAGKTTFLRALNRLVEPTAGDVRVGGRAVTARGLAQSPAVILADEPTASLDPALTGSIMDLLKTIRARRGLTLVVSQHQLETALAYATRVVGFRQGRVVFDGPPAALSPAVASTIYGEEARRSPQGGHP